MPGMLMSERMTISGGWMPPLSYPAPPRPSTQNAERKGLAQLAAEVLAEQLGDICLVVDG
jgi:hypothetical protein